jgi:hypothetical protein
VIFAAGWFAVTVRIGGAPERRAEVAPAPEPVPGAGGLVSAQWAAASAAPAVPARTAPVPARPAASERPKGPPADEPLFAGRPIAWWNERLQLLAAQQGDEARRLEALTLQRAEGLGLRRREGARTALEAPAEAPEAR